MLGRSVVHKYEIHSETREGITFPEPGSKGGCGPPSMRYGNSNDSPPQEK